MFGLGFSCDPAAPDFLGRNSRGLDAAPWRCGRSWRPSLAEALEERLALSASVTLGVYPLMPNAANQTISIFAGGGDFVAGVDFEITTGDGTPGTTAPVITAVNLFPPGGIFTGNNNGVGGVGQVTGGHFYDASTLTGSGTLPLGTASTPQLLATVTLTTAAYSYAFNSSRPSENAFSAPAITSGSFSISVGGTVSNGGVVVTQASDFPPENSSQSTFTDGALNVGSTNQNATINVTGASVSYNGSAHAPTATATGTMGENLSSLLHLSYTNVADNSVSTSAPIQAGTYKVFASFDGNGTYNAVPSHDTGQTIAIGKANPQLNITGAAATFDGNPHAATGTATGVLGENLTSLLHLTYENLANSTSSSSAPTQTGNYEVFASFDGNADYNVLTSFDTSKSIVISPVGQLPSPNLTITGTSVTFDGNPHAALAAATGISGENLTSLLHISYTNLSDNTISASAPSQGGKYEIFASFDGNSSYKAVALFDTNQKVVISKANATLAFSNVNVPFDNAAHPAAGTATGIAGDDLRSLLHFSYTNLADNSVSTSAPIQVGTYKVFASFDGSNNYNTVTLFDTTKTIAITAAGPLLNATFNVTGANVVFDGNPHPATATATGAQGEDLTTLLHVSYENLADNSMSATAPTQVGSYEVFASFDGNSAYNADPLFDSGAAIFISRVNPPLNIASAVVPADGNPQSAPVTVTTPDGQDLSSLVHLTYENLTNNTVSTTAPTQVGSYEVFASFDGNSTYNAVAAFDTGKTLVITGLSPLKGSATGRLPTAALVAGQAIVPIHLRVKLTNTSAATISGPVNVQVVLSTSPTGTTSDAVVGKIAKRIKLKAGKALPLGAATIKSVPVGMTGTVYVLIKLTDANGAINVASAGTLIAAAPFKDLAGVSVTAPATAHRGRKLTVAVTAIQNGNVRFSSLVPVQLFLSTSNVLDANAISLGFPVGRLTVLPHKKGVLHLTASIASTVTAGQYFVIAKIDPNNGLRDTNPGNNVVAGLKKVTIS